MCTLWSGCTLYFSTGDWWMDDSHSRLSSKASVYTKYTSVNYSKLRCLSVTTIARFNARVLPHVTLTSIRIIQFKTPRGRSWTSYSKIRKNPKKSHSAKANHKVLRSIGWYTFMLDQLPTVRAVPRPDFCFREGGKRNVIDNYPNGAWFQSLRWQRAPLGKTILPSLSNGALSL